MKSGNHVDFLEKVLPYWNRIDDAERRTIVAGAVPLHYAAGEIIYNAASDRVGMFLVKRGEIRSYILSDNGKEFTLSRMGVNGVCILSASCLINNINFDVFIDAEQDCDLLFIDSAVLSKLHERNPVIENFALKMAADKFSEVVNVLEQMLFMSFDRRLATFLVTEYEHKDSLDIFLTHEQIAKYIGSAREVVSRALKQFEKDKMVKLSRGGIRITDAKALAQIAENNERQADPVSG